MSTLIPKFVGYLGPDPEPLDSDKALVGLLHQRCACHIINLIVKSGLKRIKAYLEAFRTAISFMNSSNQRIAAFHNFCIVKGVRPHKFGLDMDVRWNSTYLMLKHLLPYKTVFSVFISAHYVHNGQPLLTESHWVIAEKILLFLEMFYDSTVALSGVYYPTSPLMLHHIIEISCHLHGQDSDPLLRNIVVPMKLKFLKYWQNIPLLYSFAFILDPKAKVRGFHNVLQLLSQIVGVDYSSYFTEVRTELHKLFNKYKNKFGVVRSQRPAQPSAATGKKRTSWGEIFGGPGSCGSPVLSSTPPISPASELSSYLDSDSITCYDDEFNILSWWHEHKLSYPILSILAKDVMSVPVSTVSSESYFSLTGRVIEERRRRLLPETVEMLTCLKDWELGDARAQHDVEKEVNKLEETYKSTYLNMDEGQAS
ncbi:zinc finger BED domain-containing protein RICESLEEPER 2-like [Setaria viridis]|uniref:zinc finger BED domain-containing protein RICESLEEPER 2-like n=1 Tax=Setaria viridis TaxID=4556 RepID=UPI003B3B6130